LIFDDNEPSAGLPHADHAALRSAADWQKMYASLSSMQVLTCGCFNCIALSELVGLGVGMHVLVAVLLPVLGLFFIFSGAAAMTQRRNRPLALTGSWLSLGVAASQVVLPLGAILIEQGRRHNYAEPPFYCVSLVIALALGVVGVVGGFKGLVILNKPEVVRAFVSNP
jgi:hypothetical protein